MTARADAVYWADMICQHRDYVLDVPCVVCNQDIPKNTWFILPECDHPIHKICFVNIAKDKMYKCPDCSATWLYDMLPKAASY